MKKIATTIFTNNDEQIFINEYADGIFEKVIDEKATTSSLEEIQKLVNTEKYQVQEMTW